jgi:hypothetical protein
VSAVITLGHTPDTLPVTEGVEIAGWLARLSEVRKILVLGRVPWQGRIAIERLKNRLVWFIETFWPASLAPCPRAKNPISLEGEHVAYGTDQTRWSRRTNTYPERQSVICRCRIVARCE